MNRENVDKLKTKFKNLNTLTCTCTCMYYFPLELTRRAVDMKEREFLRDNLVVTETQCDLGK